MLRKSVTRTRHGLTRVTDWPVWSLPWRLRVFVLAVVGAYLVCVGLAVSSFAFQPGQAVIFVALLACGAATVELNRRASEPSGVAKDVYAVWELPVVILLPPLYWLVVPAIRMALTQWRVRRSQPHRRVFSAAAIGLAYGCGWLVFRAIVPGAAAQRDFLWNDTAMWLAAAAACAIIQALVNQALVLTAARAADPSTPVLASAFSRESLHNDATELCAALLVALALTVTAFTLIVALPLATLLQRSFRHEQLLHEARADSKTGLLNAATWEREATAEVARAVRTGSPLAVAILDLDRFKQINDTYGHLLGDQVLRNIADTMTRSLRDYDLAGRFGGEEFVMLLPQTRAVDALRIAERIRAHIAQLPLYADGSGGASSGGSSSGGVSSGGVSSGGASAGGASAGGASSRGASAGVASAGAASSGRASVGGAADGGDERVPVTVSIGVAALDAGSRRELTELLAAADAALYRAKASGRDQVQMLSTSRGLSAVRPPAADAGPAAPDALPGTVPDTRSAVTSDARSGTAPDAWSATAPDARPAMTQDQGPAADKVPSSDAAPFSGGPGARIRSGAPG
ncbi:MAG: GGDEF domain-containing protein [Trebonia sp.]